MSFDPCEFRRDLADFAHLEQRGQMLKALEQRAAGVTDPAQLKAIQQELRALRTELTAARNRQVKLPQCPACGGRLEGHFRKCMHCASDIAWVEGVPCEPGKEPEVLAMLEKKREQAKQQEAQRQERARQQEAQRQERARQEHEAMRQAEEKQAADLKARGRKCARCSTVCLPEVMQRDLCASCAKAAQEKASKAEEIVWAWFVFLILFFILFVPGFVLLIWITY